MKRTGKDFLKQLGEMLDEHLELDDEGEGGGDDGEDKDSNGNTVSKKKPKYTKEELQRLKTKSKKV